MSMHPKCKPSRRNRHERSIATLETAEQAEVVVLTVTWDAMPEVVTAIGNLDRKILLCTNPLVGNQLDAALNSTQSGGEQVAAWFPDAKVVKILIKLVGNNGKSAIWHGACHYVYAGDDTYAKQIAAKLASDLDSSRLMLEHQCPSFRNTCYLLGQLAYGQGMGRNIAWRLFAAVAPNHIQHVNSEEINKWKILSPSQSTFLKRL